MNRTRSSARSSMRGCGARMHREDDGEVGGERVEVRAATSSASPSTSAGRCSVTSTYFPGSRPRARRRSSARKRGSKATSESIIVLPTKWTRLASMPSRREVVDGLVRVREQQVGELVGHDAVDLLGHRAIEAAQPGLDVRDTGCRAWRDERRGERRVDVAGHEHEVGRLSAPGPARARSMTRAVCSACVPEPTPRGGRAPACPARRGRAPTSRRRSAGPCARGRAARSGSRRAQRRDDGRHLHEVRSRADDVEEPHGCHRTRGLASAPCQRAVDAAGTPATTAPGATSVVTTAPAPTSAPAPMRTPPEDERAGADASRAARRRRVSSSQSSLGLKRAVRRRRARALVVDEHHAVPDEHLVLDLDARADERVALDLAARADRDAALDLDEGADRASRRRSGSRRGS